MRFHAFTDTFSVLQEKSDENRDEWGGPKGPEPTRYGACHCHL